MSEHVNILITWTRKLETDWECLPDGSAGCNIRNYSTVLVSTLAALRSTSSCFEVMQGLQGTAAEAAKPFI